MAYRSNQRRQSAPPRQQQPAASNVPDTRPGQIASPMKSAQDWKAYFEKAEKQIKAAFPRLVKFDRVVSVALTCMHRNPRLFKCTPLSVMGAMIQGAQLGLDFDPTMGEAYMVPYGNNKKAADGSWMKVDEAQLQVGYQGLMKLARNSGNIGDIRAQIVYENDVFDHEEGATVQVRHVPYQMAKRKGLTQAPDRGDIFAVYTVCETKDGAKSIKVMYIDEVEAIRQRSRAKDDGPWVTDYAAMVKKTCIRQHCKTLPKSVELAKAVTLDELHDANLPQGLDLIPFMGADPEAAQELQEIQDAGLKQAEEQAAEQEPTPPNMREELLQRIQPLAESLCGTTGSTDAFDNLIVGVAHSTKQRSQDVDTFTKEGLIALLAKLEEALKPAETPKE